MKDMPKVLLLCANYNDIGAILNLRKLGFHITVIGSKPGQIGQKYADRYIPLDYSDREKIIELIRREKINHICQGCNDYTVHSAAYVAEQLGLPGYDSYETMLILNEKAAFKRFAKKYQIPTVESFSFSAPEEALDYCRTARYPLIVKPTDAYAGVGVSKLESFADAQTAVESAFRCSRAKEIVIERFLTGSQHGFCTFLVNQKVVAQCDNDEYSFINPYRVEIDTWPAVCNEQTKALLISEIEKIASVLQLRDGIFHLQYIWEDGKPYIIEVMRRVLGNFYSIPAQLITGFNWDYWEVRARCGLSCAHAPLSMEQTGFYAYKTLLAEKNGIIGKIEIPERYQKYIFYSFLLRSEGDVISNYQTEPIGFAFMIFSSQEEMKHVLIDNYENPFVFMR